VTERQLTRFGSALVRAERRRGDAELATLRDAIYRADVSIRYIGTHEVWRAVAKAGEAAACPARSCMTPSELPTL
jgi:hypothetical protein